MRLLVIVLACWLAPSALVLASAVVLELRDYVRRDDWQADLDDDIDDAIARILDEADR